VKVLLTADWQFDTYAGLSTIGVDGVSTRLTDMLDCWRWMTKIAIDQKCERIFVVGDFIDSRTSIDMSVLDRLCRVVHETSQSVDLCFIVGNHDSYLRTPGINSMQIFLGSGEVIDQPFMMPPFMLMPWTDDNTQLAEDIAQAAEESHCDYLLAHALIDGAVHKSAKTLPIEALKPRSWKRVLLGDVHAPKDTDNIHYIGSPMQLDFGDCGGKRGVRILDTETDTLSFVENTVSPRFYKITDSFAVPEVGENDFIWIDAPDHATYLKIKAKVEHARIVRSSYSEAPGAPPRIDIRTSHTHGDIITAYLKYRDLPDPGGHLSKLGNELLERAKGLS